MRIGFGSTKDCRAEDVHQVISIGRHSSIYCGIRCALAGNECSSCASGCSASAVLMGVMALTSSARGLENRRQAKGSEVAERSEATSGGAATGLPVRRRQAVYIGGAKVGRSPADALPWQTGNSSLIGTSPAITWAKPRISREKGAKRFSH